MNNIINTIRAIDMQIPLLDDINNAVHSIESQMDEICYKMSSMCRLMVKYHLRMEDKLGLIELVDSSNNADLDIVASAIQNEEIKQLIKIIQQQNNNY